VGTFSALRPHQKTILDQKSAEFLQDRNLKVNRVNTRVGIPGKWIHEYHEYLDDLVEQNLL
jgi:hypothetical protein